MGCHPHLSADELLALAASELGDLVTVHHSNGERLVEAIAAGVSKAHALRYFAADHGITAVETIAFGDMPNGLAALSGRAVGATDRQVP